MRASDIIEYLSRGIPDIEAGGTADSVDLTASASVHLEQDTWKRNMLLVGITLVIAVHTWDTSLMARACRRLASKRSPHMLAAMRTGRALSFEVSQFEWC